MRASRRLAAIGWLAGWIVGWVLAWRLPALRRRAPDMSEAAPLPVAVVIPARDEERMLGPLLESLLVQRPGPHEIVVVDDGSDDGTAALARRHGVRVVDAGTPPPDWTGKTWACAVGVEATTAPVVVLLDADVRLGQGALAALHEARRDRGGLVSVLPEHRPQQPYEQLSAPFNLVSLMGSTAARIGTDGRTDLAFGPCLVLSRDELAEVGGFASVASEVVEDIALAGRFTASGLPVHALGGGPLVWFRMYPDGPAHLLEGWSKNMAAGAASLPPARAGLVALWVASALGPLATLLARRRRPSGWVLVGAAASGLQLSVLARRIGRFRWWIGPAQPLLMAVFSAVFARSLWLRYVRRSVAWKGRAVPR